MYFIRVSLCSALEAHSLDYCFSRYLKVKKVQVNR